MKKTLLTLIFLSLILLVLFGTFIPGCASGCKAKKIEKVHKKAQEQAQKVAAAPITEATCPSCFTEALVLVASSDVAPGIPWETPTVNYKFKFRAEGHAYSLKFSGKKDFVDYPSEGDFTMPADAKPGPVIVRAGEGETEPFRVQLYKKIKVRI